MSWISPPKSSSRAGRFKKKLVSQDELQKECPDILIKLAPFQDLYSSSQITQSDYVAAYLLVYLSYRFPRTWLGAGNNFKSHVGPDWRELPFSFEKNVQQRLSGARSLYDIFSGYSFKSTPHEVNRAIMQWARGEHQLELMFRIPSSREVLRQQLQGRRCVTALSDSRISTYILGERDALSFTMHDLIHADRFFLGQCYHGQLGFYALLDKTLDYFDLTKPGFSEEFDYLISDMNAYAVHLLKCLKAGMTHYFDRRYFLDWANSLEPPEALFKLNTHFYNPETMDQELLTWLDSFRQSQD